MAKNNNSEIQLDPHVVKHFVQRMVDEYRWDILKNLRAEHVQEKSFIDGLVFKKFEESLEDPYTHGGDIREFADLISTITGMTIRGVHTDTECGFLVDEKKHGWWVQTIVKDQEMYWILPGDPYFIRYDKGQTDGHIHFYPRCWILEDNKEEGKSIFPIFIGNIPRGFYPNCDEEDDDPDDPYCNLENDKTRRNCPGYLPTEATSVIYISDTPSIGEYYAYNAAGKLIRCLRESSWGDDIMAYTYENSRPVYECIRRRKKPDICSELNCDSISWVSENMLQYSCHTVDFP